MFGIRCQATPRIRIARRSNADASGANNAGGEFYAVKTFFTFSNATRARRRLNKYFHKHFKILACFQFWLSICIEAELQNIQTRETDMNRLLVTVILATCCVLALPAVSGAQVSLQTSGFGLTVGPNGGVGIRVGAPAAPPPPPPVYVAPAPVYVAPAPVVVVAPRPVAPPPVVHHRRPAVVVNPVVVVR